MPKTRWLDDREQRAWRGFLGASARLLDQLDRELQREHGMTLSDYEILAQLSEAPDERLRMTELASRAYASKSRLSHHIRRLIERGWVSREVCPADRRGAYAVLTAAGRRKLEQAAPSHVGGVRCHLFDQLTRDQVDALAEGFRAVQERLGTEELGSESVGRRR